MSAAQIAQLFLGGSVNRNTRILLRTTILYNTVQPALLVQKQKKSYFLSQNHFSQRCHHNNIKQPKIIPPVHVTIAMVSTVLTKEIKIFAIRDPF